MTKAKVTRLKLLTTSTALLMLTGCSINRLAVSFFADALAAGANVYTADNDPALIREALPFGLKTLESLLQVSAQNDGLLLAASRGFTAYAFLLRHEALNSELTRERRERIRDLFLRASNYALAGLGARHPGFVNQLSKEPKTTLPQATRDDVPFLYWAGASLGGAISVAPGDLDLLVRLPLAGALIERVVELDESYDFGTAHEFLISYEANRPNGSIDRARQHYHRAVQLSQGQRASVHLALAEAVTVKEQNLAEFKTLIATAIRVTTDAKPEYRLVNALARQRAAWLQKHIADLFIEAPVSEENHG